MSSIIANFEYDIFISYRQKDNKGDQWVTEFVNALKIETERTFKEDISIYFDTNVHDGLLETHNVEKSLEGKLKCLIFIPIISQTYCDTKSFAWQHEFVAFNNLVTKDQFGRDIKLTSGNIGSRILPIKIHDIDAEDKALLENELGGVLRAIEFIFKSSGVNRPLNSTDKRDENLNKTFYRVQINKVANAIKEIITSLKNPVVQTIRITDNHRPTTEKPQSKKYPIVIVASIVVLAVACYIIYPRLFSSAKEETVIDKSIAVLPFTDISEAKDQAFCSDGMMVEILDHLFKMKDLRIIPFNSTLKYKDSAVPIKQIASELGVAHLIQGSVRRAGNKVKISVALIDGSTEKYVWQHTYEDDITEVGKIFIVQSDVATQIAHALSVQITPDVNSRINNFPTKSKEAYDLYLKGRDKWGEEAIAYMNKAIAIDSTFADPYVELGRLYLWTRKSKEYLNKAIALDPNNSRAYSNLAVVNGITDWDNKAGRKNLKKAISLNPSESKNYNDLFFYFLRKFDCDSMSITLQKMKQMEPSDIYYDEDFYFHNVTINICSGNLENLEANNPPAAFMKNPGGHLVSEVARMILLKRYAEVLKILETTNQLPKELILVFKAITFSYMGKAFEAKTEIAKLEKLATTQNISPAMMALAYMASGDESRAYAYLEKGIKEHDIWVHFSQYYPPFLGKRNDPKYKELMEKRWIN